MARLTDVIKRAVRFRNLLVLLVAVGWIGGLTYIVYFARDAHALDQHHKSSEQCCFSWGGSPDGNHNVCGLVHQETPELAFEDYADLDACGWPSDRVLNFHKLYPGGERYVDSLYNLNDSILLFMYFNFVELSGYHQHVGNNPDGFTDHWSLDLYNAMIKHVAWTTDHDTAKFSTDHPSYDYPTILLNPLNPGYATDLAHVFKTYYDLNYPDGDSLGIWLDFFPAEKFLARGVWDHTGGGFLDMDRDCIPLCSRTYYDGAWRYDLQDTNEWYAWIEGGKAVITALHDSCPTLKIIGNGKTAYQRSGVAALLDGFNIENLGQSTHPNALKVCDSLSTYWSYCDTTRGGPYMLLDYQWNNWYPLLMSKLFGGYAVLSCHVQHTGGGIYSARPEAQNEGTGSKSRQYHAPMDELYYLDLSNAVTGSPLAYAVIETIGNEYPVSREFENGTLEAYISTNHWGYGCFYDVEWTGN